jgi:hypothetical protein
MAKSVEKREVIVVMHIQTTCERSRERERRVRVEIDRQRDKAERSRDRQTDRQTDRQKAAHINGNIEFVLGRVVRLEIKSWRIDRAGDGDCEE